MIIIDKEHDIFHVIADKNRRKLLDLLSGDELPVKEIAANFDISMPAVSQHLKILLNANLVSKRTAGSFRLYRARPDALREVHQWTSRYQKFWKRRLGKLGEYLDSKK